jgi:hypothetical protein
VVETEYVTSMATIVIPILHMQRNVKDIRNFRKTIGNPMIPNDMDIEEMKVYIDTLEKENDILRERNDKLYEQNCNQAKMLSRYLRDDGAYSYNVMHGSFKSTAILYNTLMATTASTSLHSIHTTLI